MKTLSKPITEISPEEMLNLTKTSGFRIAFNDPERSSKIQKLAASKG